MPMSGYENTVFVMDFLSRFEVGSILDVGAGFGRWGFLCRCHIGGGNSLTVLPEQDLRIEAVEIFDKNISPIYEAIYNNTYKGNAREIVSGLGQYDVIICGDMIEHLEKKDAWALIGELKKHAVKALVLSLPLGDCPQGPVGGNVHEAHLSRWEKQELVDAGGFVKEFPLFIKFCSATAIWAFAGEAKWALKIADSPTRRFLNDKMGGLLRIVRQGMGHGLV